MPVYVDDLRPVGASSPKTFHGRLCHMMADTDEELEAMARRLGLLKEWRDGDHYDLAAGKRCAAVASGAIEVDSAFLVKLRRSRRERGSS